MASYAQIATIDENLVRRVLHAADVAWLTAERKRLYLARHPETAATSAGGSFRGNQHTEVNDNLSPTFTEATATATGTSVRAVERNARRGNALKSDLARIAGTSLDKGTELDALVKLTPDQRAPIVERANAGEKVSAVAAIAKAKAEKPKREAESDEVNEALSDAEIDEVDRYIKFRDIAEELGLDLMPSAEAIALSNMIHHRANKGREYEAARWVWQYRRGVALSHIVLHDDGAEVRLIKDTKEEEAAIRAVAREVNADGRHRENERPTDLSDALSKTDLMGYYLGRLSVVAFCYWAIVQKAPPAEVRPFFDELAKGPTGDARDARHLVARALYAGRRARNPLSPNDMAETILRGWINYRKGIFNKVKLTGTLPTLDELAVIPVAPVEPKSEVVGVVEGQPMAQHSAAARAA